MELKTQGSRPRTQKTSEAKDSPFEDKPFLGQGHRRKCSPKKKIIIIMSSKKFFQVFSKKQNQKISKKTSFFTENDLQNFKNSKNTAALEPRTGQYRGLKASSFFTKNDLQNFKNSKNTAVLEPRTGQYRGLEASRPRTSKCVLEDSTSVNGMYQ